VDASEAWQKARSQSLPKVSSPFDWTYTSHYLGTLAEDVRVEQTDETIDFEKLMRRDPILFYDTIPFYVDELADNGDAEIRS
jgi:type 2A phosphatase activator TIP41